VVEYSYENIFTFFGFDWCDFSRGLFGAGDERDYYRRGCAGSRAWRHQHFYQTGRQTCRFAADHFDAGNFLTGHQRRIHSAGGVARAEFLCRRFLDGVLVLHRPLTHQCFL